MSIRARRDTVFRFFTDPARFAAWWGRGSTIDARPGGEVIIRYPNGAIARGEVLEVEPASRIVFTYGYDDPGKPILPGGSRVTITLEEHGGETRVLLRHDLADAGVRDQHVPGWRFQLSLFANAVAADGAAGAAARVDDWFRAWAADDPREILARAAAPDVAFHDRWACLVGLDELAGHIAAARRQAPGTLVAAGAPRLCQGRVLAAWEARDAAGKVLAAGDNLFELDADGRIARVVGFAAAERQATG